jgi:nucleoside-diphosphate-sugar epimerase
MNIILSGGGGYIGVPLTAALLAAGHSVTVFDQFYFGTQVFDDWRHHPRLRLILGDIRRVTPGVFEGANAVIQLAAMSNDPSVDLDPALAREINLTATVRAAELAKAAGVERYIFSSSCSVYGDSHGFVDETSAPKPVSLYAQLKLEAEAALDGLSSRDFVVSSLRSATVYGVAPRMRFDLVVNTMTLHAWKTARILVLGGGQQWRPLIHVSDVANAFVLALKAPADVVNRAVFNVGDNAENYQVRDVAEIVRRVVPDTVIEEVPDDPDVRTYRVAFDRAAAVLGFRATHTVENGAREVLEGLRSGRLHDDITTQTLAFYRRLRDDGRLRGEHA